MDWSAEPKLLKTDIHSKQEHAAISYAPETDQSTTKQKYPCI